MTLLRWTAVTNGGVVDLPDVLTSTLGLTWGEATGGEVTYSLHGQRADLIDARLHEVPLLRAHMAVDDKWVPVGGDLVARQVQADREAEAPTVQVSLVDAVADTLGTVTLWPKDGATTDADGNRLFTAATAGSIVLTWLAEAQARGEARYVTCKATPTHDSAGNPWNREATLAFGHEEQSLAAIVEALWASGMCDWHTKPGGELVLLNAEESQSDRSGTVVLHAGADVGHAPQTQGTGDTAHTIRVIGDDGKHVVIEDPELPVGPTGKRSAIVSGAGATDEGTLRTIGEAWIKQNNRAADHLTRELVWQGKFLPLADYYLGDHITAPGVTGAMEKCRVSEITLTTEGNELTPDSAISLNGKYSDPLLRLTKRQNGIIGASKTGGGNNTRPRPDGPDKRTPATPTGLSITSEAYTVRRGQTAAVARAVWAPVTTDERGVAMEVRAYEVRWRRESPNDRPWRTASVTDTDHTVDNLAAGGRYEWQVRAVGAVEKSAWSASKWHTNGKDATPPPKPSTPTLTATRRIVTVNWDGFTAEGGRMPLDTSKVQVATYSASTLPAQITADMIYRGGVMWDPSGDWESPLSLTIADSKLGDVFARIRAVDDTGNASEWSDEAHLHVKPTVDVGEIDDEITDAINDARDRIGQITDEVIPGIRGDMDAGDRAAQAAAARAASEAAAAQQTADRAVSDAAAAAGRSTTVWQATAPTDKGVLWIKTPDNTPHVWDGSKWVPVTDQAVLDAADAASEARAAAQAAQEAADAAQRRAEEAVGLANAAQSAAEAAQATADGAQSDADQALQDAARAAGAAKAIRSPEPPADKTVLWIDSDNGDRPHLWNGSVWELVTDQRLTDAADAAGDAQQAADAAQRAADAAARGVDEVRALANAAQQAAEDAAQDAADAAGKSAVVWQSTAPADTTVLWIKTPGDTPYVHDGTEWVVVTDQRILDAAEAADDARNAAQAAQEAADAAQRAADAAMGAAQAAQSTADRAVSDAADARDAADAAAQAALDAAGKTRIFYGPNPPAAAADDGLWIDDSGQPHVWDGNDWAPVTNQRIIDAATEAEAARDAARNAQAAADAAQAVADAAEAAAGNAQAAADAADARAEQAAADAAAAQSTADAARAAANAADAKALEAAGIAAGKGRVIYADTAPAGEDNALWVDIGDGNTPHRWDGTQWVVITDQAAVDAAAAADAANDAAILAQEQAAAAQAAAQAAQEAADAAQEAADNAQGTADEALARAITADGRVTVSSRVPVTADGKGKPVGALWQTYSGDELVAFYRWDGSGWKAMPLSRSIIPLLDIGQGTFGTLDGARLKAGSVATNRLAVTDWANLVENPAPEMRPAGEDGWGGAVTTATDGAVVITRTGASNGYGTQYNDRNTPVAPGDTTPVRVTAEVRGPGLTARVGTWSAKADGSTAAWSYGPPMVTSSTWQVVEATITPPTGAVSFNPLVQVVSTNTTTAAEFRNVTARRQTPSVLIENGAITADKITASEELTAKIGQFLKLKAGQIDVNSLAADEVFAGLMQAQVLRLGAVHPEHLSFGTDEIIPDPLWFDAARRSSRSRDSGGWTYSPATDWPWAATGGQTHVLRAYNGSLKDNDSVALTDITAAAPGEVLSLEMTAGCTTRTPTGTIYFQAVYRRPDGSLLFSTSNAVAAASFKTANRMQTFRRVVTVPDGVDGVMFRIVAGSVTNASTGTWAVSRVSARKGNVSRDQSGAGAMFSPQGAHIWNELGEDTFKVGIDDNALISCDTFRTGTRTGGPQVMLSNTVIGTGLPGMWLSDSGSFGNSSSRIYLRQMPEGNVLGLRSAGHTDGRRPPVYAEGGLSVGPDSASTARLTLDSNGNLVTNNITRFLAGTAGPYDTREAFRIDSVGDLSARAALPTTPGNWTTGNAANMYIGGTTGNIFMCTSVLAAKVNVTTVGQSDLPDPLDLRPVHYYDRSESENRARYLSGDWPEEEPEPRVPRRFLGLIAEEVEAAGFPELVTRDEDGELQGVAYERLAVALLPTIRAQQAQIKALTARLDALEAR